MRVWLHKLRAWVADAIHAHALQSTALGRRIELPALGGVLRVTAYEISVIEVRRWLQDLTGASEFDAVDQMLFADHDITIDEMVRMSTARRGELERLAPSELVKLADAVKEVNPFFFQFRQRLRDLGTNLPTA